MKINWKIRAKNPQFWLQIALAIVVPVGGYFGITGADVTTWSALGNVILNAVSNPYVLFIIGVSVYNSVADPTTRGFSDSRRALNYDEPSEGVK